VLYLALSVLITVAMRLLERWAGAAVGRRPQRRQRLFGRADRASV
jgi:hypothetical protein